MDCYIYHQRAARRSSLGLHLFWILWWSHARPGMSAVVQQAGTCASPYKPIGRAGVDFYVLFSDRRASCCLHLHCHDRRVRLRLQRRTACSQLTNCILQPRARCMACAQPVRRSSICLLRRLLPRTHLPNSHEPLRSGYPAGPDFWCHWLDCLLGRGRCRCVSFHHRCHRVKGRHREPVACVSTVSSCAEMFH